MPQTPEPPYIPGAVPDLELYDDGVIFLTPFIRCQNATIAYSICTENEDVVDFEGGRYLPGQITTLAPNKRLYINIWIDWNLDGDWDDVGEHVHSGAHDPTLEWNGSHCSGWRLVTFHVPWDAAATPWLRARLDYGENVGRPPYPRYDSDPSLWRTYGLAQFGEVEDCIIHVCCPKAPPTEWVMFSCDPTRSGYSISPGPCTNNTLWTYPTGDAIYSSPAVAEGKIFVGSSDRNVYAIDAETGTLVWNYATGGWVDSSPAAADGRVFVGSWDGNIYALDAEVGTLVWRYTTGDAIISSPAVADGKVFVGSSDGNFYALDAETGNRVWRHTVGDWIDSSPAVVDGKVFFGSVDGFVYALDAETGGLLWNCAIYAPLYSSPAVACKQKVFIVSLSEEPNQHGKVYSLDAETGTILWTYETGGQIHSSPAVANGTLFIGSLDGRLYAFRSLHDVLITNVVPLKTIVGEGYMTKINATIKNNGDFSESFNIIACTNSTVVQILSVTLDKGNSTTITLAWNTAGLARGNYMISVYVAPVPDGYECLTDTYVDGIITVVCPGDVDADGEVNIYDVVKICAVYGCDEQDPKYDFTLDINSDGKIDLYDVVIACSHYGQRQP